jgi:hypothetical protein
MGREREFEDSRDSTTSCFFLTPPMLSKGALFAFRDCPRCLPAIAAAGEGASPETSSPVRGPVRSLRCTWLIAGAITEVEDRGVREVGGKQNGLPTCEK